ncbi:MAG: hypothetical protein J7K75_00190 [Desulfuromonas sp.]|nr:hypothetical protein [Desulfuromonas sp.]
MIYFEAKKQGLKGLNVVDGEKLEHWKVVLKREWYFSLPLIIITVLMIMGRSPGYSAFWATLSCIVLSWLRKETRMGPKEIWEVIPTGLCCRLRGSGDRRCRSVENRLDIVQVCQTPLCDADTVCLHPGDSVSG